MQIGFDKGIFLVFFWLFAIHPLCFLLLQPFLPLVLFFFLQNPEITSVGEIVDLKSSHGHGYGCGLGTSPLNKI